MANNQCKHEDSVAAAYAWCMICGTPLGNLEAVSVTNVVALDGADLTPCAIRLQNTGQGLLWVGVPTEQMAGVQVPPLPPYFSLAAGQYREIRVHLDRNALPQNITSASVKVWGLDGHRRADGPPLEAKRDQSVPIKLHRVERKPLVHADLLLVRPRRSNPELHLYNLGNVDEVVTLQANNCEFKIGTDPATIQATVTVAAGGSALAVISTQPGFGKASIAVTQAETRTVEVVELSRALPEAPEQRYTVGIDFGTSKSAVFFILHWKDESEPDNPLPVLWPDHHYKPPKSTWWLESAIAYPDNAPPKTRLGWDILSSDEVIRDMKTRLRLGQPIVTRARGEMAATEVVADFLRSVWAQMMQSVSKNAMDTDGTPVTPDQIMTVLSMPVGETARAQQLQRERTEAAARAAFPVNTSIKMVLEPACAAADFLLRGQDWGFIPSDGQIVCVFDCGAGTTDISVVRVSYAGSRPTFEVLCQCGYEFGGNFVDRMVANYLLAKLGMQTPPRVKRTPGSEDFTFVQEDGISNPAKFADFVRETKMAKDQLRFPIDANEDDQTMDFGDGDFTGVQITRDEVDRLVEPVMEAILSNIAKAPSGIGGMALKDVLENNGIDPQEIRWICLTGGSVLIPTIVDQLQSFFRQAILVPRREQLPDISRDQDRPLTKNVVRGASAILQVQTPPVLGFDLSLTLVSAGQQADRHNVLAQGATPGAPPMALRPLTLQPNQDGLLYVKAKLPQTTEPRTIYVEPLAPTAATGRQIRPRVALADTGEVTLQIDNGTPIVVA